MKRSLLIIINSILVITLCARPPATGIASNRVCGEDLTGLRFQPAGDLQIHQAGPDFGPDGLKGLTEEQKNKVLAGQVVLVFPREVESEGKTIISAALIFEVPVEQAWAILSATERQADYIEEIEELKMVEQGQDYNRMFFLVKVMGQKVRYTVIHHFNPGQFYLWWELDRNEPHDLKELHGFWKLFRYDDHRTVARYGSLVKPAFPVPAFLRNWLERSNVRSSLARVKKYVEGRK